MMTKTNENKVKRLLKHVKAETCLGSLYMDLDCADQMVILKILTLCDDVSDMDRMVLLEQFVEGSIEVWDIVLGLDLEELYAKVM